MNTRIDCSPRIIKRIHNKGKTDDASKYAFYRQINHLSIIRLDNEADKLNYSSWLTRLDNETSDLKMHLIKILFISLRSDKSFQIFLKPPPDDLKDLELRSDNTMDMVKWLQDNNIADESSTNEEKTQEIKHKRSAAVATNMRSYTTIKTSPYFVQSFYVRSDWPIYTWYNPTSIRLPSNYDHNQWELFLNRFQIVTEDKNASSKHRNECDDIIPIDQVSKEVTTTFNWHPYSILASEQNRPKRTAGSIEIDLDIANQLCNQQEIDDAAFAIVSCKVFPGNKILSERMYSDTLIPDAKFIFKMTGVTIVDYSSLKLKNYEDLPFICKLKQRKQAVKNQCGVKDKTPCPCEKPMMTIDCSKPQSPCSKKVAQNAKQIIQTKPSTNTISTTKVNTESDSKFSNLKITYQECKSSSKCLKRSAKKTKPVESCKFPKEADLNVDDNNESKEPTNCPKVLNAGRSSFNDSPICDWTVSSMEISMREPDRVCSSTPPAAKAPNCKASNCASISSGQVDHIEPEDQNARNCSSVQETEPAATPPRQCLRTTEVIREPPPQEHCRRPSLGSQDGTNSEPTENVGCADTICSGVQLQTSPGQKMSTPEPRDRCASARGPTSDDGCKVGQCPPNQDQNRSCPAAFAEHRPNTPRGPDTSVVLPTDNDGRADTICSGGRRQTSPAQRMSAPEPRDRCASARGPTSDDGRKVGPCPPSEDQNRSCPAALAEHRPTTPREPDTSAVLRTENGERVDTICSSGRRRTSSGQRMSAPEPRDRCASARGLTSDDGRWVGQCPGKDQNRSCPAAFAEHRPKTPRGPDTSVVSGSDRSVSQPQQHQHNHPGPRSDDRSDTAAPNLSWNPEVNSYSAFSDSHMAENRSRFLTSERTVDDRSAVMRSWPSSPLPQLLPANDFYSAAAAAAANDDNDLSDDSFGATSDWSAEQGFNRCQSCAVQTTNRFDEDDYDNNNNNYYTSSSLSTLTSSDSSIEMRLAARHPLGRNVNYERRTERLLSTSSNDRYPFDGSLSPNLSDVGLRRASPAVADVWPPAHDLVEDVSMPGSLITGPWSLSMNDSRSGRFRESSDVGSADQYHTNSCSEGGNASGRPDYGGSETDDDGAGAAPVRRRNY